MDIVRSNDLLYLNFLHGNAVAVCHLTGSVYVGTPQQMRPSQCAGITLVGFRIVEQLLLIKS